MKMPMTWSQPKILGTLLIAVAALGTLGYMTQSAWWPRDPVHVSPEQDSTEIEESRLAHDPFHLLVSESVQRSSGVRMDQVTFGTWNDERIIPAKLELDPAHHYAVTAPADVIVEELLCPLGTQVRKGDPLLEMSSSQLTTLRGGLVRQQLLTRKAQSSVAWHREIETRVNEIIAKIEATMDNPTRDWMPPPSVQTADYGARILSAFAKYWAATELARISQLSSDSGITPARARIERTTDLESAKAMLRGAIEQSRFDIRQAILAAESDLAAAEGALQSTQADMRKYLGMKVWNEQTALTPTYPESPDRFIHNSPGDGMVWERYFANGERASTGELVLLVADISSMWLVGDLRQKDWDLLQLHAGDQVQAQIVGLESLGIIPATIQMVGGNVQQSSGSIRLTASIENTELRFRPGMIARLIFSQSKSAIVVPATALFSNDGKDYLVRRLSEESFQLVPVHVGHRKQGSIEILSGVEIGDTILVEGVFQVASQAFLEKE